MARVVRADHDDDTLGLIAVEFPVFNSPENMFGAVCACAEVEHLHVSLGEIFFKLLFAGFFPIVRDRVSDEYDFCAARLYDFHFGVVSVHLPAVFAFRPDSRGGGADCAERGAGDEHCREGE